MGGDAAGPTKCKRKILLAWRRIISCWTPPRRACAWEGGGYWGLGLGICDVAVIRRPSGTGRRAGRHSCMKCSAAHPGLLLGRGLLVLLGARQLVCAGGRWGQGDELQSVACEASARR